MKILFHILIVALLIFGIVFIYNMPLNTNFEKAVAGFLFVFANGYISYWVFYMQKKGENRAIVDDIDKITKIAEEIKHDVALVSENRISFQSLRRDAIVNFYEKYFQWLNHILFLDFESSYYASAKAKLESYVAEYSNAESRLKLFDEDFDQYEVSVKSVSYMTMVLQQNYLLKLHQYRSVTNSTHLLPQIASEYYGWRDTEYQKMKAPIKELSLRLRKLIRTNISE